MSLESNVEKFVKRLKVYYRQERKVDIILGQRMEKPERKFNGRSDFGLFYGKFKKKYDFSLNSGNLCVTLQLEMCPYAS